MADILTVSWEEEHELWCNLTSADLGQCLKVARNQHSTRLPRKFLENMEHHLTHLLKEGQVCNSLNLHIRRFLKPNSAELVSLKNLLTCQQATEVRFIFSGLSPVPSNLLFPSAETLWIF